MFYSSQAIDFILFINKSKIPKSERAKVHAEKGEFNDVILAEPKNTYYGPADQKEE